MMYSSTKKKRERGGGERGIEERSRVDHSILATSETAIKHATTDLP